MHSFATRQLLFAARTITAVGCAMLASPANANPSDSSIDLQRAGPTLSVSPSSLRFGNQPANTPSAPKTLTVTNTGTAVVTIKAVSLSTTAKPSFSEKNTCVGSLAAGQKCTISVVFDPQSRAAASGAVSLVTTTGNRSASVSGTGVIRPLPAIYATGDAVAYSPYRAGGPGAGEVPPPADILQDLQLLHLAGFNLLRLYGSDPVSTSIIQLVAQNYPTMGIQLGVYLEGAPSNCQDTVNSTEIATAISLANQYPQQVLTVSVGNETSLARNLPVSCLASYISQVRAAVKQPITTDDVYDFYSGVGSESPSSILPLIDFAAVHIYAYSDYFLWNWQQTSIPAGPARATAMMNAGFSYVQTALSSVQNYTYTGPTGTGVTIQATMPIVIGETGWKWENTDPSQVIGTYAANPVNAKWYLDLMNSWRTQANGPLNVFYFEAFNEAWKGPDDGWGLWTAQRTANYALCATAAQASPCNSNVYQGAGYYTGN